MRAFNNAQGYLHWIKELSKGGKDRCGKGKGPCGDQANVGKSFGKGNKVGKKGDDTVSQGSSMAGNVGKPQQQMMPTRTKAPPPGPPMVFNSPVWSLHSGVWILGPPAEPQDDTVSQGSSMAGKVGKGGDIVSQGRNGSKGGKRGDDTVSQGSRPCKGGKGGNDTVSQASRAGKAGKDGDGIVSQGSKGSKSGKVGDDIFSQGSRAGKGGKSGDDIVTCNDDDDGLDDAWKSQNEVQLFLLQDDEPSACQIIRAAVNLLNTATSLSGAKFVVMPCLQWLSKGSRAGKGGKSGDDIVTCNDDDDGLDGAWKSQNEFQLFLLQDEPSACQIIRAAANLLNTATSLSEAKFVVMPCLQQLSNIVSGPPRASSDES